MPAGDHVHSPAVTGDSELLLGLHGGLYRSAEVRTGNWRALVRMTYSRITSRWLNLNVRWRPWLWIITTVLILLLTIRQQLNVDLLVNHPAV